MSVRGWSCRRVSMGEAWGRGGGGLMRVWRRFAGVDIFSSSSPSSTASSYEVG